MTTRLQPVEITDRIKALQQSLTAMQAVRLTTIRDLLDEHRRFVLRQALEAGEFTGDDTRAQDAFRDFRNRVNKIAKDAGVDLRLELDSHKVAPDHRYGWFEGNPIDKGLVTFSEDAAEELGVNSPVAPEVAELNEPRSRRVYVSFHPTTGDMARRADALIKKLTSALKALAGPSWEVADSRSTGLGEDIAQARERLCDQADVCVSLISPSYLTDSPERGQVFGMRHKLVAFTLSGLPHGSVDLHPLQYHEISHLGKPWDQLRTSAQRTDYVNELVAQIQRVAFAINAVTGCTAEGKSALVEHVAKQLRGSNGYMVDGELAETSLQESLLERNQHETGTPLRAVERLVEWATDDRPGAPRLCALLGDVGMGKTTTAKLFTQRLLELHESDPSLPMPILFDLRDVRITGLDGAMTLDRILDNMLDATRRPDVPPDRLNSAVVRSHLEAGPTVIVFDGLDEVLVHLSPHDRQLFTRQLWRALPAKSPSKMLLTCRTQYFRTIRDEVTFFTGETRKGLRGNDYLALLMLPFRDEQIREYLKGNLDRDDEWVDRFLETIGAVHNLTELSQRPITLRLIADQVEFIETAKLEGRTLRSIDIYAEVVDRWIARDEGKHTLIPDHKRLLMEEIAAGLWRSGKNAWSPAEVDDWLLNVLEQRPDLRLHYRGHLPDLWTADFRTATFLKREGDTFQFAHRSLFEYFLARYLYRTLSEISRTDRSIDAAAMAVPSPETLDFLGQSIAAEPVDAIAALQEIGRRYRAKASELALAYVRHARRHGYPHQSLAHVDLSGATLQGWRVGEDGDGMLSMIGANFTGANLRRATFVRVDLSGADFTDVNATNAEFHQSELQKSSWRGAKLTGTTIRRCGIDGIDFSESETYRTQLLMCTPSPSPGRGLLVAPTTRASEPKSDPALRLNYFAKHMGSVRAAAWSPDNSRILTGGHDTTARIWDVNTGQLLYELTGHSGWVLAAAWSPDNTHIFTGDIHGTARTWDANTGQLLHRDTTHSNGQRVVAWSPDNTHILTGGADDIVRAWNVTTGEQLHGLLDASTVGPVAWSPDNTRILTGSTDNSVRIWNANTGQPLHQLTGHSSTVDSVAWSPDNTRILTGSRDTTARIWDANTGQLLYELTGLSAWVQAVAWSPDNTRILTADVGGTARFWGANTGQPLHQLTGHIGSVECVAWSSDNTRILIGDIHGIARTWDANTGQPLHQLTKHTSAVKAIAWSPDNTQILTSSTNGAVQTWETDTGRLLHKLQADAVRTRMVAWSPDRTRIAISGTNSPIRICDANTGQPLHQLGSRQQMLICAAWSPDNTRILIGNTDGTAWIWDANTGQPLHQLTGLSAWVQAVAWSPDNTHILTGDSGGIARVWDANTGQPLHQLTGHTSWVQAVAWSPDNTHILTGSHDGTARIWDANTHQPLHQLTGHTSTVNAVAWSPDGTHILTSSMDNSVRIWDANTGQPSGVYWVFLPADELAILEAGTDELVGCTDGAWRWLGWNAVRDGRIDRLPAEYFGPLPQLTL